MITSSKEAADFPTKQEGDVPGDGKITNKPSSSTLTSWLRLKDPRIVRVSRAFGGKDRHSKVCTVRGLRDRRVRLSVPTAIQLYDLQDRLGLNQPSKVVDWLLNAAKDEIDELPPLQMPPVSFSRNHPPQLLPNSDQEGGLNSHSSKEGFKINDSSVDWEGTTSGLPRPNFWSPDAHWRGKSKEVATEITLNEKENSQSSNFFPKPNTSSLPGFMSSAHHPMPYSSFSQWEPSSNFPALSHLGSSHGFVSQMEDVHNMSLPSTLSLSSGSQILVCPSGTVTQSYFPASHVPAVSLEIDPRQINHFQMLSSGSSQNLLPNSPLYSIGQSMRPFHFSMTPRPPIDSQNSSGSEPNKDQADDQFPSK